MRYIFSCLCFILILASCHSDYKADKQVINPDTLKVNKQDINSDSLLKDENNNEIFTEPEEEADFPGGEEKLFNFLDDNLNKVIVCDSKLKEGVVWAGFEVDTIGHIKNLKIKKSYNSLVDNELLRVIKLMPNWIPGTLITNNMKGPKIKIPNTVSFPLKIPYKNRYKNISTE